MPTSLFHGREEQVTYRAVTFRKLLDSLARPGKMNQLTAPTSLGNPPSYQVEGTAELLPVNLYALGAIATLLDAETSFALSAHGKWLVAQHPVATWLAVRSGSHVTAPELAEFALFCDGTSYSLLAELSQGSLLEPETSATAFCCVERLTEPKKEGHDSTQLHTSESVLLELTGPGIPDKRVLTVHGLSMVVIELIQATRRSYPRGIDLYLIDALGRCVGLPRTTKIRHITPVRG